MSDPVQPYGFGASEIACIIATIDDEARARAAHALSIDLDVLEESIVPIGASSLMAHGMLMLNEDEGFTLLDQAAALRETLNNADSFVDVGLMADAENQEDAFLVVISAETTIIMHPRMLSSWFMFVKDPKVPDVDAAMTVIEGFIDATPKGLAYLVARTAAGEAPLSVQRDGEAWRLTRGESPLWSESGPDRVGHDEMRQAVSELLVWR